MGKTVAVARIKGRSGSGGAVDIAVTAKRGLLVLMEVFCISENNKLFGGNILVLTLYHSFVRCHIGGNG